MRKHHGRARRRSCASSRRGPTRCARWPRWLLPGHDAARYRLHAVQALLPGRGEGIREAAEEYNRRLRPLAPRSPRMRSLLNSLRRRWPFVLAVAVVLLGVGGLLVYNGWIKEPGDVTNADAEFQDTDRAGRAAAGGAEAQEAQRRDVRLARLRLHRTTARAT